MRDHVSCSCVRGVAALALTLLFSAQTKIERDANGHIVITNTPPTTTLAPAAVPAPLPVLTQPVAVAPPIQTVEALTQFPFSFSAGDSSSARITLGPLPRATSLFTARDGRPFAVHGVINSGEPGAPFPFHFQPLLPVPRMLNVAGDDTTTEPRPTTTFEGVHATSEKLNVYVGEKRERIPVYEGVRFREMARGIDVTETLTQLTQQIHITVAGGTDLTKVHAAWDVPVSLDLDGSLLLKTDVGQVRVAAPRAVQNHVTVAARWKPDQVQMVFFEFDNADATQPIDIDFDVNRWIVDTRVPPATSFSVSDAIATDEQGNVYIADEWQGEAAGAVAVEKFDAKGKLIYTTVIGGYAASRSAITLSPDENGQLWVAFASNKGGVEIARLGSDGVMIESAVNSTIRDIETIRIDPHGVVYTAARQPHEPLSPALTKSGFQNTKIERAWGTFAAILDATNVRYATYLGRMEPTSVAFSADGKMVVGGTAPPEALGPSPKYAGKFRGGEMNGFLLVIDPSKEGAESFVAATYVGNASFTSGSVEAVACDRAGNVYAAGFTSAPMNAFVASFDPKLKATRWSMLLGGNGDDRAQAIAVDRNENVYVAGTTKSTDFKTINGPSHPLEGDNDAHLFAARINSIGTDATWSLLLGAGAVNRDIGNGGLMTANDSGDLFIATRPPLNDQALPMMHGTTGAMWRTYVHVASCVVCPQPPSITRLTKGLGSKITIEGSNFQPASRVLVNGSPAADFKFISPTKLEVAGGDGAEVSVINPDQTSATSSDVQPSLIAQKRVFVPGIVVILIILIAAASRRRHAKR
jgi:hypothetical protein